MSGAGARDGFGGSVDIKPATHAQPPQPSVRLAYTTDGTAIYQPVNSNPPPTSYQPAPAAPAPASSPHGLSITAGDTVKRKRGRPRKYGPDGSMPAPRPRGSPAAAVTPPGFSSPPGESPAPTPAAPGDAVKKARGRPPGSTNKKQQQMAALGSGGIGFTPHVITVKTGEDVSSKVMSFTQNGSRAVCILAASGAISNVTLGQSSTSGGTVTYEGRFDIISLTGSFLLAENGGQRSRTGGLSVSLASPDGRILGGGVAGLLTAASPVQIIAGSFIPDAKKEPKQYNLSDPAAALARAASVGMPGASSPPSRGTLSESSGGAGSPPNQSGGYNNNSNQQQGGLASFPWK